VTATIEPFQFLAIGDSDRDDRFDSSDLVDVFQAGEYEDGLPRNSTWATGDWSADREFTSGDLVIAFQAGTYEQPAAPVLVPEPAAVALASFAAGWLTAIWRARKANR
jgi:hypothetical protein